MATDDMRVTDANGLIDPFVFPKQSNALGLEWAEEQAEFSRSTGRQVAESVQDVHAAWSALPEDYQAPEADTLYRVMDPELGAALREQEKFEDAAHYLLDFVDEVRAVQQKLANLEVEAAEFRAQVAHAVGPVGGIDSLRVPEYPNPVLHNQVLIARAREVFEVIAEAERRCADRIKALDEQIIPPVSTLGPYLAGGTSRFSSTGKWSTISPADVAEFAPTQAILDGSASEVREWWDTLTPEQRATLVAALPMVIGNLNGVPVMFRAQANRTNIRTEITRLEAEKARIDQELTAAASTHRFGASKSEEHEPDQDLLDRRAELQAAIDSYGQYLDLPKAQYQYDENGRKQARDTVEVVTFDPASSSIATYHGPYDGNGDVPEWIDNVAVHVPGTTTRMDAFNGTDIRAYQLYDAANNVDGAGTTAMFAWAGGAFPQGADAASASYSRDLGPKLVDFTGAIDVHKDSTLTVTGHSYGGAAVGIAEREGLHADRILYVAGAGEGNDNTSIQDFPHTKDLPHYAMMARNDLVVGPWLNGDAGEIGHGASPLDDPGVTRLETGFIDANDRDGGDLESRGGIAAHSDVYTKGSTSFNNIVGVITGTRVEAYAPDRIVWSAEGPVDIDGIDAPDYQPRYIDVE